MSIPPEILTRRRVQWRGPVLFMFAAVAVTAHYMPTIKAWEKQALAERKLRETAHEVYLLRRVLPTWALEAAQGAGLPDQTYVRYTAVRHPHKVHVEYVVPKAPPCGAMVAIARNIRRWSGPTYRNTFVNFALPGDQDGHSFSIDFTPDLEVFEREAPDRHPGICK